MNVLKKLTEQEVVETLEAMQKAFEMLDNDKELAEQVNFEFEKFADSMYTSRAFTPWTQIDLMKNQNINVQVPANEQQITEALAKPTENENRLIGFNQGYYFSSFMYKRNLEYMSNLPAFDLEMYCCNANKEDYKSKQYKKDWAAIKEFFRKFDYRTEFRKALWSTLQEETYYCFLREFDNKILLEPWPFKYAQITGRFEYGFLFDIDLQYFLQPYVDINMYPDWVKEKYLELFGSNALNNNYKPSNKLNKRTGKYATWAQTSPEDGAFAFKFTDKHNAQIPFFSAMLPEMAMIPLLRKLQENQSIAAARKLVVSSIPYLNEKKSSSVVNQIAISPELLGKFLALATQGLENAIKVLALPTEDIKGIEFKNTDEDTYKNFMDVASSLLSGGKVIFAPGYRQNAIQTQLSLDLDRQLATSVYSQMQDFLEYYANQKTTKFKWKFRFVGTQDWLNREARQKEAFAYADKGIVLPNKIASSLGMNKIELEQELDEMNESDFVDKLRMLLNVNTMGNVGSSTNLNDKNGRPQKNTGELSDSGIATRDNANNIDKGGKV